MHIHNRNNNRLTLASIWCLLAGLFVITDLATAATSPGTMIQNQAELSYVDADTGETVNIVSNITTITVGQFFDFSLLAKHSVKSSAGEAVILSHQLVNTGNTTDSYFIGANPLSTTLSGDQHKGPAGEYALSLEQVSVYHDLNGNGVVDQGEPLITSISSLAPGQSIDIVVRSFMPSGALPGTSLLLEMTAKSLGSNAVFKSVFDEAIVDSGSVLKLQKMTVPECGVALFPNDQVTHKIDILNSGTSAPDGVKLMLGGSIVYGIVVEQIVPPNMAYQGFAGSAYATGAIAVVRLSGVAENSWIRASDWDGEVPVVSTGLLVTSGQLLPQLTESFTTVMRVTQFDSESTLVSTSATVDLNGDRQPDFESNNTCSTFSVPSAAQHAELRFLEPAPGLRRSASVPDINLDSDFVEAVQYQLDRESSASYVPVRDGFYLELEVSDLASSSRNIQFDAAGQRYVIAEVQSAVSGDIVNVVMMETSTAGLFRSIAPVVLSTERQSGGGHCPALPQEDSVLRSVYDAVAVSCVLGSGSDDELVGRYLDSTSGFAIADVAIVHPRAMVFNSQTLLPVEGAVVSVRLASTDEIAVDIATGTQLESISGPDGLYELPRLEAGARYYLHVEPPSAHKFPSVVSAIDLPTFQVSAISYGRRGNSSEGTFIAAVAEIPQPVDIPVDSNVNGAVLGVEKQSMQVDVELGQVVSYSVAVKNLDTRALTSVVLEDRPPFGFRYVPMSTSIGGVATVDPDITSDGVLVYDIGPLESAETVSLVYSLRASAGAIDSDGINSAVANAVNADNALVVSSVSSARVSMRRDGVLSDRAALFGKIYVDQNCDGLQNHAEWPIGGVKLYLQDGTYTVSDADGLFSLYGLRPGSHVIKVDKHTMPAGLELKPLDSNQGVDPDSRFIDLMTGDFHRVDFAANCPIENRDLIFAEIKARNESINGSWLLKEAEQFRAGEDLPQVDPASRVQSLDGDLSNGLLDGPAESEGGANTGLIARRALAEIAQTRQSSDTALPNPKEIVADITKAQAKAGTWLWPQNELSVKGRFMAVVRDGIEPTLYVNGEAVPANQIGERMANRREKAQIVAWYGVELTAGENTVEVKGVGPFGNERILATGVFKKPSSGEKIKLTAETDAVEADGGRSIIPVKIQVLDEHGYPALGVYFVTLENSDGGWVEADIQDSEPGRQIRVNNGSRIVNFTSSSQTGKVTLRASTGEFSDEISIQQVSEVRPLLGVGFIEVGGSFSSTNYGAFAPSRTLQKLDGKNRFHSHAAVFAKGQVKGKYNLTLSYDSEKNREELLLRDINPSAHYPIHGDASIRGYEAQSRSKLYLKLERDKRSLMWGDYLTDSANDHEDLARSRRTLTGFNSVLDDDKNRIRFFVAQQQDQRVSEEVPGNGSAMLYRLESYPIVSNSEVVELITRSRDNPGLVVARTRLQRFGDYTIDPIYGYVTFSTTIPTLDDQLNPVFVQISYDVESGGENYLVSGVRFDRDISENTRLGFSHTTDGHSQDGKKLSGIYATYNVEDRTRLSASVAVSDSIQNGVGTASRITVDHTWKGKSQARTAFAHARADAGFNNSGASVAAGRVETRINHKQKIKGDATLVLDAVQSDSTVNPEGRRTLSALVESRLREWLVRAGLKQITQEDFGSSDQFVTAIAGVSRNITIGDKVGQIDAEVEQDTGRASRHRVALGAKLQVHEKARVYSNFELSNSLLALTGTSNNQKSEALTLGVETSVLPSTRLYSEYRMRGAFDSRDYETASGVRGDYEIQKDLRVTPTLEIINTIDGATDNDSFAASIGLVDTRNENSRRLVRLETRQTDSTDYIGFTGSYAARVNEDWTAVLTENLSKQNNSTGEDTLRHSFVAGFARRPKLDNRHHMLLMYSWKEEKGLTSGLERSVHMLSTHQNLQLSNRAILSGRFGGKHNTTHLTRHKNTSFALLADVRLNFDFNRRINVDLRGGVLASDGTSQMRYSAGAGLYYVVNKNARVGIGYNFAGFKDSDLDAEEYNAHGWHFGLQYKFDEDSLKWLE